MTVDILILGAGWTSTFLIPLCHERHLSVMATSRSGRDSTVQFEFNADSDDVAPFKALPSASTVLITFPIDKKGGSERLVRLYSESRAGQEKGVAAQFIQLGATSLWDPPENKWYDRHSPILSTPRGEAEEELLALSSSYPATVLNLAGLWGGSRSMRNWVGRVASTKEVLKNKGSIHMIHGLDVARAILAVHGSFSKARGQRWMLTDGRVYDWWDLASAWGSVPTKKPESLLDDVQKSSFSSHSSDTAVSFLDEEHGPQAQWVRELMEETGVRALPRSAEVLGRALDGRDFWREFGLSPIRARLEG
ncbi:hypothetical protein B0H34DRAFT_785335 [Crassisporium funariophilum]|nr:hypothetical protein B0H34DRAFT_785335 [Crassisporium funariophilum]